jgi:serine/threonine protein kinase
MTELSLPSRFRVLEVLQEDHVQVRLRAADEVLQREVVLELPGDVRCAELDQGGLRARILREARMLAKVHHSGVQPILDVLEHGGMPILLLAPRQGRTLEDLLGERSRLPAEEVERIGIQVAEAAQAVHAAGVVHRDLREANILVTADGSCVLTGFGFAKPQGSPFHGSSLNYGRGETAERARVLPEYPAPEQLRGAAADARSDVYGLGCVLAHCLTGTAPKPEQVLTAAALSQQAPLAPRRLVEVIAGCLAPVPSARFPTMQAVAAALRAQPQARRQRRMLPWAIAALVLSAPLVWAVTRGGEERGRPAGPAMATGTGVDDSEPPRQRTWYRTPHALVIGIDYVDSGCGLKTLANAERDASAVVERLLALGWPADHVQHLSGKEATWQAIQAEFNRLRNRSVVDREDQVFLYFAGHGERHSSTSTSSYLLPYDAAPREGTDVAPARWIPMSSILDLLAGQIVADHILIALDCCHVAMPTMGSRGQAEPAIEAGSWVAGRARLLLGATDANQLASDGRAGGHSPFCEVFLDGLDLKRGQFRRAGAIFSALRDRCPAGQTPNVMPPEVLNSKYEFVFGHY